MSGSLQTQHRVLVVAHTTTFLTELSLFGKLMRARTDAQVLFYCAFTHWTANDFAKACSADGVTCLLDPLAESFAQIKPGLVRRALRRVAAALSGKGLVSSIASERLALALRAAEIRRLLVEIRPRLLVLGGDMPGYDTSLFVKIAHAAGVPVMVVPSTMSNGLEQAEVYFDHPDHQVAGWLRNQVAARFPNWIREHRGRRLFRCPPGRVVAMELAGIAPPQPWIFNSGHADAITMESEAMIDYYAVAGMKNDRMVLTGSLSDDAMSARIRQAAQLRSDVCRQLGFDPERPLFLAALPPDFLYVTGGRPQCDFQDYRGLADFWVESLASLKDCNCLVALHPSVEVESMRWIERPGVRIAPGKTADLVPLCDVYVASISSTIRWAIACGKPVVNYDVYRYRYTDFLGVPGVLATEEQQEFRTMLDRLASDGQYRDEVARVQQQIAARWGLLDGKVGDRMLMLVQRLSGIAAKELRKLP